MDLIFFERLKKFKEENKRKAILFEKVSCDATYRHKLKDTEMMSQLAIGAVYVKKQK